VKIFGSVKNLPCLILASGLWATSCAAGATTACPNDDTGLKLPPGFCATIFADDVGHARHMVVAPNGVLYVNTWSGGYYEPGAIHEGGFLVALQDTTGTGRANVNQRFGDTSQTGGAGGTGIALYKGALYAEINDRIVSYKLSNGSLISKDAPEVVVSGLPLTGDHPMHPFAIDAAGLLYVTVASATNSCQEKNRELKSPGISPCTELETRSGIWRYDAKKRNQKFSAAERYVTGIRNADGIAFDPSGQELYATQHGRDQLSQNWPDLYTPEQGATLPAEVLLHIKQGADYGWPVCYQDPVQGRLVLAPEYGGDGGKAVGVCAAKTPPVAAFPAHWGPNAVALYGDGKQFPARYRNGAFIAFHGSWNRAPFPQGGFNVVFQSLSPSTSTCEIFADGFGGRSAERGRWGYRPSGLAVAPDGALYISDDIHGRIYKVVYRGGAATAQAKGTPCPSPSAPAGVISVTPTETINAAAAKLPVAAGATKETVALGANLYSSGITCAGCHGDDATGTQLGPNLTDGKWLWSDGSLAGIAKSIAAGVPHPKEYRAPMPALGGAQLNDAQVSALAAYIWGASHGERK
jgi:glucose/arabinose dehydrogenase/mono/diheme cytochrome c family protein